MPGLSTRIAIAATCATLLSSAPAVATRDAAALPAMALSDSRVAADEPAPLRGVACAAGWPSSPAIAPARDVPGREVPAPPMPRLAAHGPLRAGDVVELTWAPTPAGVEELELLLSLDGGRSWHVRVSPALPGGSVGYRWRVPNLPSADARVRVRMRLGGREIEGPGGERFAIQADAGHPVSGGILTEGAWWTGLDLPCDAPERLGPGDAPSLAAARRALAGEESPRPAIRPLAPSAADPPPARPRHASRPPARARAAAPERHPLRN